jgi:hypothetical protein
MGRTRHRLDPAFGLPAETDDPEGLLALQVAQGLVGTLTRTGAGGSADLRHAYGATRAHTAFDEYSHTADFRRGRERVGWHNIPRLGVFLWRLRSFGVETTPVAVRGCDGHYAFDPTGRQIPLFAQVVRTRDNYGDRWVSPAEWQLPTPISTLLLAEERDHLYPRSLAVLHRPGSEFVPADASGVVIYPEIGRFKVVAPDLRNTTLRVRYHYGFASEVGAGPYDRRILGEDAGEQPERTREDRGGAGEQPEPMRPVQGGGNALTANEGTLAPTGTLTVRDSLTYDTVSDVGGAAAGIGHLVLRAENLQRPLIRLPAGTVWAFTGADEKSVLVLEGLFISGGDILLHGKFERVTVRCCTLDPGMAGAAATPPSTAAFAEGVDGRPLVPCTLRVEGRVDRLEIVHSIAGPIATVGSGTVGVLVLSGSIVQAVKTGDPAIALDSGRVEMTRCTLLGPAQIHRLTASECILDDVVTVGDPQHGCVRFSAFATGSVLPLRYEWVEIAPGAPLFTSRVFGQPGYAQLPVCADTAILAGAPGATISEGAEDGSEMGVFARQKNPIKERSLQIKYNEFMPLGLIPVIVHVT